MKFCPTCGHSFAVIAQKPTFTTVEETTVSPTEAVSVSSDDKIRLAGKVKSWVARKSIMMIFMMAFFPYTGFFVLPLIMLLATFGAKIDNWEPKNLGKERRSIAGLTIASGVFSVLVLVGAIIFHILAVPALDCAGADYWLAPFLATIIWLIEAIYVCGIFLGIHTLSLGKKLTVEFYGRPDPIFATDIPSVTTIDLIETTALVKRGDIVAKKPPHDRGHIMSLIFVILAVVLAAIILPLSLSNYKFLVKNVRPIELGDSRESVRHILGDPFFDPDEGLNDLRWEYYSSNYTQIINKINSLENQAEQAFLKGDLEKSFRIAEQQEKLEKRLKEIVYRTIVVTFDTNGRVTSVYLNSNSITARPSPYNAKIDLSKKRIESAEELEALSARVTYDDGSYTNSKIRIQRYEKTGENTYTITWLDYFEQSLTAEIYIAENVVPMNSYLCTAMFFPIPLYGTSSLLN